MSPYGISRNRARIVDGHGKGRLAAGHVERGESAIGSSQEAVNSESRATRIVSRNGPRRIDAESEGAEEASGARAIESGHGAVGSAQEAVNQVTGINVIPRNCACRVDALGEGALAQVCAGASARGVEGGQGAARGAQEGVKNPVCVQGVSRNRARRVDARGEGALARARARARSVERGERSSESRRGEAQCQAAEGQAKRQRPSPWCPPGPSCPPGALGPSGYSTEFR